jgi:hypothetical protein
MPRRRVGRNTIGSATTAPLNQGEAGYADQVNAATTPSASAAVAPTTPGLGGSEYAPVGEQLRNKWGEVKDEARQFGSDVRQGAQDFARKTTHDVLNDPSKLISGIQAFRQDPYGAAGEAISQIHPGLGNAYNMLRPGIERAGNYIGGKVSDAAGAVRDRIAATPFGQKVGNFFNQAGQAASNSGINPQALSQSVANYGAQNAPQQEEVPSSVPQAAAPIDQQQEVPSSVPQAAPEQADFSQQMAQQSGGAVGNQPIDQQEEIPSRV